MFSTQDLIGIPAHCNLTYARTCTFSQIASVLEVHTMQSLFAMIVIWTCMESVHYKITCILLCNYSEKGVHGPIFRTSRPFRHLYAFVLTQISWLP